MAGFSNTTETNIMKLWFMAVAVANIADNAASSPITNVAFALHTADPADAGTMTTSEAAYTSYARVNVLRSASGFGESGGVITPVANIDFPTGTGGSGTDTHFSAGKSNTGSADIFMVGTVTPNIVSGNGVLPRLTTATTMSLD